MSASHELIVFCFSLANTLRILAYFPQIRALARDSSSAAAVACSTWVIFFFSNIATVAYAVLVLRDLWMTTIFSANSICCAAIVCLVLRRRCRAFWRWPKQSLQKRPANPDRSVEPLRHAIPGFVTNH